jgi:hypothetical protein
MMLTQADLKDAVCKTPGCECDGVLVFHSKCHPDSPTWTQYHKDGFLEVFCAECAHIVAQIEVAA